MDLSVCMIVKDEAASLPRCLASLEGIADEVCVVDTGSRDDTVALAEARGARVGHVAWQGDFSAARNVALGMARGRWILSIDADEELDRASVPALRAALADPSALGFLVTVDSLVGDGRSEPAPLPRLFRNRSDIRFSRAVHESVMASLVALGAGALRASGVRLVHHGYVPEVVAARDKHGRNAAILRAELARNPGDLYALHKLAATLRRPGEGAERSALYARASDLVRALSKAEADVLPFLPLLVAASARDALEAGRLTDARERLERGIALAPSAPELAYGLGNLLARAGHFEDAVARLDACRGLDAPGNAPSDPRLRGVLPCLGIARVGLTLGDLDLALAGLDEALAVAPNDLEARALAARVALLSGDVAEGVRRVETLCAEAPAAAPVATLAGWLAWQGGDASSAAELLARGAVDGLEGDEARAWLAVVRLSVVGTDAAVELAASLVPRDLATAGVHALGSLAAGLAPALDAAFDADAVGRVARALVKALAPPEGAAVRRAVSASALAARFGLSAAGA